MTPREKKNHGWLWKLPLGLLVLLLAGLVVMVLSIDTIARGQIKRALGTYLAEGGALEAVDIGLTTGRIALSGVTIHAPKGHGTLPLLKLGTADLKIVPSSLFEDVIVVDELTLKGMSMSLARDRQGRLGLDRLLKSDTATTEAKSPDRRAKPANGTGKSGPPIILVKRIRLEDGSLRYQDSALTGNALVFPLSDIRMAVDGLRLFDDKPTTDPAALSLSFLLQQPGNRPPARFGAVARLGTVDQRIPPVNIQSRLVGLKLDTLGSLIPPATRAALGGDGLDMGMAMALTDERISLDAVALTDHNIHYDTIKVRGPLTAPVVGIAPVWTGVFRVTGGVLNIGKSSLGAGISIAESGIDVVKDVGSGALKIGEKLLGGLFDTGKGLATLDTQQLKKGLVGSTAGTIDLSLKTVGGAGGTAESGLSRSVSHLTGSAAVQAWNQTIPQRYESAMRQAREALEKMPYPPAVR